MNKDKLKNTDEPVLKAGFKKISRDMSLPRILKEPSFNVNAFKTTTAKVIALMSEGFGNHKEIAEITKLDKVVLNTIVRRIAPIYYKPLPEFEGNVTPRLMYGGFEYKSANLAIFPLRGDDINTLTEEPYFEDVMNTIADKLRIMYESPCEDPLDIDNNSVWVKFSFGLKMEFGFINGTWENFAILRGYLHNDRYYPLNTPYQLPAILPVIADKIGTHKGRVSMDEIVKLESEERIKDRITLVIERLDGNAPTLKVSGYDLARHEALPSDWLLESSDGVVYIIVEGLTITEMNKFINELSEGFSLQFEKCDELIEKEK